MERVSSTTRMAASTKDNGRIIRCTVRESSTTMSPSWHTRENGISISFMGTGKFTMTIR